MKHYLLSFLLCLLLPFGCSSSTQKDPAPPTLQELLTTGTWTSMHEFEDLDLDGTFVEFGDDCDEDNPWTFQSDGTLNQGVGAVLCDPDEDDPNETITSQWELKDDDVKYLIVEFSYDEIKFLIVSISEHELILQVVDPNKPVGVFTHRVVLNR